MIEVVRENELLKKRNLSFFGSKTASIILTILFFLISMFFLFFKADIVRKILEKGGVVAN